MTEIDLHTHSTYSDGLLTPDALCALAVKRRLTLIALCDHDTTDGLGPMAQAVDALATGGAKLRFLPAVELSAGSDGRTHILGYGARADARPLAEALAALRAQREQRGERMVRALAEMDIHVPPELIPKARPTGMTIGRPHIARALLGMGVVNTVDQAFDRYLSEGKPAYIPLTHLTAAEAVTILRQSGAVPVLAHPARLGLPPQMVEALVESLMDVGLMGVEVYHPSASRRDITALQLMAKRRGLLVTGGSDYHGDAGTRAQLGGLPHGWHTCEADAAALLNSVAQAGAQTVA